MIEQLPNGELKYIRKTDVHYETTRADTNEQDDEQEITQTVMHPHCLVWTALPLITWILPFIGHTGLCDAKGWIHDFAGSFYIGLGNFAFGPVYK
jgi:hypothetical protein